MYIYVYIYIIDTYTSRFTLFLFLLQDLYMCISYSTQLLEQSSSRNIE